jgi:hypothetical protein
MMHLAKSADAADNGRRGREKGKNGRIHLFSSYEYPG